MTRQRALSFTKPLAERDVKAFCAAMPQGSVRLDEPLCRHCTIGIGGPAALFLEAGTADDMALALKTAAALQIPVLFLGKGSNLLFPDEGLSGLVVKAGEGMSNITQKDERITAGAGATTKAVARLALTEGLSGYAFASGIPASVGGAAAMNAGAFGGEMAQVVDSLTCLDRFGEQLILSGDGLGYRYRHSRVLDEGLLVLSATYRLTPGDRAVIRDEMDDYQARRQAKQPLQDKSAGSFFKRPPGHFAGQLIEEAGLKGFAVGGAMVSPMHAGFIVNKGGATAADVLGLVKHIKQTVWDRNAVVLEPEVQILAPAFYLEGVLP